MLTEISVGGVPDVNPIVVNGLPNATAPEQRSMFVRRRLPVSSPVYEDVSPHAVLQGTVSVWIPVLILAVP